ncbi:MAG: MmgE/PrpD family protein [Rhodospirillales bacterium]
MARKKIFISPPMDKLSRYIAAAGTRKLPVKVAEKTKHHVLDTLAAMISGSRLKPGKMAIKYIRGQGGTKEATVIGSKIVTTTVNAALANGMMGHADETDDSHFEGKFHPGCGIVPAALAVAEKTAGSGEALLRAVALGYDVGARINRSLGITKTYQGGHSTHTLGAAFGAAAAAGLLFKFDPRQVRHMLSYTGQQASGLYCWARDEEHIEKAFDFAGQGARNGVSAAGFVAAGFTGVDDVFSGHNNFYSAIGENPKPDELAKDLGKRYEIMQATIKKWCVGSPIQAVLDAGIALIEEHGVSDKDVERIVIEMPDDRAHIVDNRNMPDICVQHMLAIMLIDGGVDFASAHDYPRMKNARVLALRKKMTVVPRAKLTKAVPPRQIVLEIATKDGRVLRHHTRAVRGTPANPMPRAEVEEKALDLTVPILGVPRANKLIDTIWHIERLKSVRPLRSLLQA